MPIRPWSFSRPAIVAMCALAAIGRSTLAAQEPEPLATMDQSIAQLTRLIDGLTVTPRVLMIGMHPDDEDTRLITWLSRGKNLQTGYLSITRGEAGVNFGGSESGASLGAIRTQEVLAARRIDGADQFFTRAFDFGTARTTRDVFDRWTRDSIVGDIVAVIRSFRPHVLVAMVPDSAIADDGQHQALEYLVILSVAAARDSTRFAGFGAPWAVRNLYQPGRGFAIETAGFDRASGKTFAELALESRAQHRSQGLARLTEPAPTVVLLRRMALRPLDGETANPSSLFDGIDTSLTRFVGGTLPHVANALHSIVALADSTRTQFNPLHPERIVPHLALLVQAAGSIRSATPSCKHPSAQAVTALAPSDNCDRNALDLDASIDLVRDRAMAALLAASKVSIEAVADRELVATSDTASVTVTVRNHGTIPVTLSDVTVWGGEQNQLEPMIVPPDSSTSVIVKVAGDALAPPHPWWIGPRGGPKRGGERFAGNVSAIDGLSRADGIPSPMAVAGVVVPENIRRTSDVRVSVQIAGVTMSTSIGPAVFRHADGIVGLQNRQLAGVPNVTFRFPRGLEWLPKGKPLTRALHVAVTSHLDREQEIDLSIVTPQGMPDGLRVDSVPKTLRLGPREQRDLMIQLRGTVTEVDRKALGLIGKPPGAGADSKSYETGLQVIQREYVSPIRTMPASGEWMQPIDIKVPPDLTTIYVPGGIDDIAGTLRQVGTWVTTIDSPDQLLSVDLTKASSILIGVRAFEVHPELAGQAGRLLAFVRQGGTLVILRGGETLLNSGVLPYKVSLASPVPERILRGDPPVRLLQPSSRLLTWPNRLTEYDWWNWVGGRAELLPTTVDSRYGTLIETHDPDEPDNRNAILTARLGKGTLIYTTLTLEQQIAGGIPGGLRLLVNLLSATLSPEH